MKPRALTRRSAPFLACWVVGVGMVAWAGTQIDGYKLYVMRVPLPHPYPWYLVLVHLGILSVEIVAFYAVVRPESYQRSWVRALAAFGLSLALVAFFLLTLMHGPPPAIWHWLWLVLVSLAFLVLLVVSLVSTARPHAA